MSDFRELSITLDDGYEAYSRYWPAENCSAAVLYLHGIQSHCGWYTETARSINQAGMAVLQPDRRGSGRNDKDRGHADSAGQLIDDGFAYARTLRELSGIDRIHIIGVSWGGKLAAAIHATDPAIASSLSLIAPGLYPIVDVSATEKFRIGWSMVADPTKLYNIPLNNPELFTDNLERIRFLQNDEYQIHQASAGFFLASRRMDKIWAKIKNAPPVPLRVFLAGEERIIDNDKTGRLIGELDWPDKQVITYPNSRHTIEFGSDQQPFTADLVNWLTGVPH